jgi:PKHD-type hydroxylase
MLLWLQNVLLPDELERLRRLAASETFVDGRGTAGKLVSDVKRNEELDPSRKRREELNAVFFGAVNRNQTFIVGARPKRILPPIISRYKPGMTYGDHVDNAIGNPTDDPVRIDLSMTLFLSDPASYGGGELVIHTEYGTQKIKLPAGDAIVYPTTFLHHVAPVTEGVRLAAIAWMQSLVRDAEKRKMLYDVSVLAEWVHKKVPPQSAEAHLMEKIRMNLLRMWVD